MDEKIFTKNQSYLYGILHAQIYGKPINIGLIRAEQMADYVEGFIDELYKKTRQYLPETNKWSEK